MKKVLTLIISLFIFNISVIAVNSKVSCTYKNVDNKDEDLTAVIAKSDSEIPDLSIPGYENHIIYGNNNSFIEAVTPIQWFNNSKHQYVQDYYDEMNNCPDYFYVYDLNTGYGGFFSDKENIDRYKVKYKLFESSVSEDENGNLVEDFEKYSCQLKGQDPAVNNKYFESVITINYTSKNISFSNGTFEEDLLKEYVSNFDFDNKNICPEDLVVCINGDIIEDSSTRKYYIMSESQGKNPDNGSYVCNQIKDNGNNIEIGTNACHKYIQLKRDYDKEVESRNYSIAKQKLNTLKSFCRMVVQNHDYNNYKYSCINLCLNINKDIKSIIGIDASEKTCGFSNKLISWVLNIIKWIKYIIPAIVILFGILDFVKAIGSDKDDEMKKAQGRFIKRLIAAALIFIVPFIIEFTLDKMGFEVSSCGIIRELD